MWRPTQSSNGDSVFTLRARIQILSVTKVTSHGIPRPHCLQRYQKVNAKLSWFNWKLRGMFELCKSISIYPWFCFKKPLETQEISRCLQAIELTPSSS